MILKHYYYLSSLPQLVIIFIQQAFIGEAPPYFKRRSVDIYKTGLDLILITTQKRMKKGCGIYMRSTYINLYIHMSI